MLRSNSDTDSCFSVALDYCVGIALVLRVESYIMGIKQETRGRAETLDSDTGTSVDEGYALSEETACVLIQSSAVCEVGLYATGGTLFEWFVIIIIVSAGWLMLLLYSNSLPNATRVKSWWRFRWFGVRFVSTYTYYKEQ